MDIPGGNLSKTVFAMKTCVFITGTNSVGKTSLAKALIGLFGGIEEATKELTICRDRRVCFAGRYSDESRYGGVDAFNCTRVLPAVVKRGLETSEVVICEGSYLDTFGNNLINAMFQAQKYLIVFLYAPGAIIHQRLLDRGKKGCSPQTLPKQKNVLRAAKKWAEIGIPVQCYDTGNIPFEEELESVYNLICKTAWGDKFIQ